MKTESTKIQIGMRFGRLLIIKKSNKIRSNKKIYYICECDCGIQKEKLS